MKPVSRDSLPAKGLPRGDYVVGLVGQIATDIGCQRLAIGERLLFFALYNARRVPERFGLIGVALGLLVNEDEDPEETARRRRFYLDRGFIPLADDENRLYISMKDVRGFGISEQFGEGSLASRPMSYHVSFLSSRSDSILGALPQSLLVFAIFGVCRSNPKS